MPRTFLVRRSGDKKTFLQENGDENSVIEEGNDNKEIQRVDDSSSPDAYITKTSDVDQLQKMSTTASTVMGIQSRCPFGSNRNSDNVPIDLKKVKSPRKVITEQGSHRKNSSTVSIYADPAEKLTVRTNHRSILSENSPRKSLVLNNRTDVKASNVMSNDVFPLMTRGDNRTISSNSSVKAIRTITNSPVLKLGKENSPLKKSKKSSESAQKSTVNKNLLRTQSPLAKVKKELNFDISAKSSNINASLDTNTSNGQSKRPLATLHVPDRIDVSKVRKELEFSVTDNRTDNTALVQPHQTLPSFASLAYGVCFSDRKPTILDKMTSSSTGNPHGSRQCEAEGLRIPVKAPSSCSEISVDVPISDSQDTRKCLPDEGNCVSEQKCKSNEQQCLTEIETVSVDAESNISSSNYVSKQINVFETSDSKISSDNVVLQRENAPNVYSETIRHFEPQRQSESDKTESTTDSLGSEQTTSKQKTDVTKQPDKPKESNRPKIWNPINHVFDPEKHRQTVEPRATTTESPSVCLPVKQRYKMEERLRLENEATVSNLSTVSSQKVIDISISTDSNNSAPFKPDEEVAKITSNNIDKKNVGQMPVFQRSITPDVTSGFKEMTDSRFFSNKTPLVNWNSFHRPSTPVLKMNYTQARGSPVVGLSMVPITRPYYIPNVACSSPDPSVASRMTPHTVSQQDVNFSSSLEVRNQNLAFRRSPQMYAGNILPHTVPHTHKFPPSSCHERSASPANSQALKRPMTPIYGDIKRLKTETAAIPEVPQQRTDFSNLLPQLQTNLFVASRQVLSSTKAERNESVPMMRGKTDSPVFETEEGMKQEPIIDLSEATYLKILKRNCGQQKLELVNGGYGVKNPNFVAPKPADITNTHQDAKTSEGSFLCKICGKDFKLQRLLNRHLKCHSDVKRYLCTFCGKGFNDTFDLKRHTRIHTGVKPYACDQCDKSFTQRCSLESHSRKVHGKDSNYMYKQRRSKVYVCEDCGYSTTEAETYYHHLQQMHPDSPILSKSHDKRHFKFRNDRALMRPRT